MITYPCSCCSFLTLTSPKVGSYEVCPVCFWEDDLVQNEDVDYAGGANQVSLSAARNSFISFGATNQQSIKHVRPPMLSELPPVETHWGLEGHQVAKLRARSKMQMLAVVRGILSRHIGVAEGSVFVASRARNLEPCWSDKMAPFVAIASETDDLPLGQVRQHWAPDALARKDDELAAYESRVREGVLDACRALAEELRADLVGPSPIV